MSSILRVVRLLAGVSVRRWRNRLSWRRRKKGERAGTARKGGRSPVVLVLFAVIMLFNALGICSRAVGGLASEAEQRAAPGDVDDHLAYKRAAPIPDQDLWPAPAQETEVLLALGLVLTVLLVALVFIGLGSGNVELSQAGWTLEWLYTFPVPTRSLFAARVGEYALTNVFGWLTVFPLLWTVFASAGLGWGTIPLALGLTLLLNAVVAAARLASETALRKRLSLHRLKNMQALFTIVGIVLFFAVMIGVTGRYGFLLDVASALPDGFLFQPLAAPLLVTRAPLLGSLLTLGWGFPLVTLGLALAVREVRTGLIASGGGPYRGRRGKAARPSSTRPLSLLGKEVQLLLRDRNFLVQTFVMPILLLGYWMFIGLGGSTHRWGPDTNLMVAFLAGAYVLMYGGFSILATEVRALWLLYTFPQSLARLLRSKVVLWGHVAAVFTLALGTYNAVRAGGVPWFPFAMALGGVYLMAVLAGAMGVMGTDPFETEPRRKMRPEWIYLYMLVAGSFAFGIVAPSPWARVGVATLTALLAVALWDRVRDRLPLLLDPTARAEARITLTDGVVGALAFLQLQVLLRLAMADAEPGTQLVVPFFLAGAITVLVALYLLWRSGVRPILPAVGLGRGAFRPGALLVGVAVGAACAAFAQGYLFLLDRFEVLEALRAQTVPEHLRWAVVLVAVVGAPPVEEFLFRGLLYTGLRRVTGPRVAVMGSAVVFGVVHPAASFIPVFVLGAMCAVAYARTRSLWAPIMIHAVYNAGVVLL